MSTGLRLHCKITSIYQSISICDFTIQTIHRSVNGSDKMNVKLEICKGE